MQTQTTLSFEQFSTLYMKLSLQVAQINKRYGCYINVKLGQEQGIPVADVTIPAYAGADFVDEERISPLSEEWKITCVMEAITRFEQHLEKQAKTMQTLRDTIGAMTAEALDAVRDYLTGTKDEPLARRERVMYEMVLAEQVRRKTK